MTTLVIHPTDSTTDFLKVIYQGKDWTVITDPKTSTSKLKREIKSHDRIIMLGHGSEYGLLTKVPFRCIIDSDLVYLLREKNCVCIWCNADEFVKKYDLKGFYTGMIISEYEEALLYSLYPFSSFDIEQSNTMFAGAIKQAIDCVPMLPVVKSSYYTVNKNSIVLFNQDNLYER